ncbi:MAG: hypothetical protein WCR72_19135, partial [Bacteroidota bacterium]
MAALLFSNAYFSTWLAKDKYQAFPKNGSGDNNLPYSRLFFLFEEYGFLYVPGLSGSNLLLSRESSTL